MGSDIFDRNNEKQNQRCKRNCRKTGRGCRGFRPQIDRFQVGGSGLRTFKHANTKG